MKEIDLLTHTFSAQRLGKYWHQHPRNEEMVVKHYKANLKLAESLYTSLSVFEVTLRNALSREMERMIGRRDWYVVFPSNSVLKSLQGEITIAVRHISQRGEMVTPDKIISELTFGFWITLLNSEFELTLWKGLRKAFPNLPKKIRQRKTVSAPCNRLRKLRNRVFHHEAICWDLDYITETHKLLYELLGWMNKDMPSWLNDIDRFDSVCANIRQNFEE